MYSVEHVRDSYCTSFVLAVPSTVRSKNIKGSQLLMPLGVKEWWLSLKIHEHVLGMVT
jgi:hypothetical protein